MTRCGCSVPDPYQPASGPPRCRRCFREAAGLEERDVLVVTIEVWHGGSPLRKEHLGSLSIANVSDLAETSDYEVWSEGERVGRVRGHARGDGAWALLRRALRLRGAPR